MIRKSDALIDPTTLHFGGRPVLTRLLKGAKASQKCHEGLSNALPRQTCPCPLVSSPRDPLCDIIMVAEPIQLFLEIPGVGKRNQHTTSLERGIVKLCSLKVAYVLKDNSAAEQKQAQPSRPRTNSRKVQDIFVLEELLLPHVEGSVWSTANMGSGAAKCTLELDSMFGAILTWPVCLGCVRDVECPRHLQVQHTHLTCQLKPGIVVEASNEENAVLLAVPSLGPKVFRE
mmetsp:Transcript_17024/g.40905  ORF Transcript_17024/g.40905 Transcript_17024/m.40905 type:complete len:230 (-) Transcript_17024:975-1664(-)